MPNQLGTKYAFWPHEGPLCKSPTLAQDDGWNEPNDGHDGRHEPNDGYGEPHDGHVLGLIQHPFWCGSY